MDSKKILITIPAYNEVGNVGRTVQEIISSSISVDILVVDDGSSDATAHEARQTPALVASLPFNLGIGGAVQTGFRYALQEGYPYVVQMDGDGQHDTAYLKELLAPVFQGEADMTIGSRFIGPFLGYRSSFVRRIGINFFAHLISFLTGYSITDPTSGFRAYNTRAIKIFAENYPYDFPEPEAIVVAQRAGLRIKEVPVQMRKRTIGVSSIRYMKTLYYMIKVTVAILLDMVKCKSPAKAGQDC